MHPESLNHEGTKARRSILSASFEPSFRRGVIFGAFEFVRSRTGIVIGLLLAGAVHAAEAPNAGEDRLRAALRDATLQQRSAQAELASLQAAQAALVEEKKALNEKFETLKKQIVADKGSADKTLATLNAQLAELKAANAKLTETLEKTRAEGDKAAQAARSSEAQGTKLTAENVLLQRRASDLEAKNLALYLLGNEILTRYEDFGLGTAIKAKEPFVGRARARLENLVQDYQDKLLDQRAAP